MRVLHVVKTSVGAEWAALQAAELARLGVEVHVALPDLAGRMVDTWRRGGAVLHTAALDFPLRALWTLPRVCDRVRRLVDEIAPDVIHSHHVGPTLVIRQ